ncbi:MAG TPA: hypothetical protein VHZ09_13105 [Acidobacteriaceae bacterium]|jgi:hypothetical protein|nr:hypothetical protein [Acidobacteriaceae bacterium]
MTTTIRTIALAALVSIASLAPALHAQTLQARFNVPFSFDCGSSHLAAGPYTITVEENGILTLRQASHAIMALTHMGYVPTQPSTNLATFKRYGDRYFLTEISTNDNLHVYVAESGAEKRATRELARRGEPGTQVAIALLPAGLNRAGR